MNKEEILFMKKCFKVLAENHPEKFELKKAIDEEKNIPNDMKVKNDESRWKLVESNLGEDDILMLEEKFNIKLPYIYIAFLCAYYHLFEELEGVFDNFHQQDDRRVIMYIVQQPSNSPLSKIEGLFEECIDLINFGYIPIGDFYGWGPLCFDVFNNYKLVWLDHEEYYDCETREELEDLGETIFDNFRQFMECFFCGNRYDCGI